MLLPLPTPFAAGLGQRAEAARSRLLWDADFRTMPRQVLPTTQAVWKALIAGGYASAAAAPALSNAWIFDMAASTPVTDLVGGKTLSASSALEHQRPVIGLLKGAAGQRWHRAVEWNEGTSLGRFAGPATTDFDPGVDSFGVLVVLRHGKTPTTTRALIDKRQTSGAGWQLSRTNTGEYQFVVSDGVNTATLSIATPPRDAAPHYIYVRINRAVAELQGFTDMGAVASVPLGAVGAVTSSVTMVVGGGFSGHAVNTVAAWQCAWVGFLTAAAAENITSTHLGRFWTHAKTPAVVTTYNRAGRVLTEIENDPAFGVRLAGWQSGQFAWERDSSFPGYGLGAAAHGSVANKLTDSDVSAASWTKTSMAVTGNIEECPNGQDEGAWVEAVATTHSCRATVALTNGDPVSFSIYAAQRFGQPAPTVIVSIWDSTFTTLKVQVTVSGVTTWQRVSTGAWTADATANFGIQLELGANGQRAAVWGAQVRVGDYDGPLAFSDGSAHTCPATDIRVTGAAAAILRAEEGEVVAEYSCAAATQATDRFVVDVSNAASNVNRRAIKVASGGDTTLMYDSGGVDRVGPAIAAGAQSLLQHQAKRAELAWAAARFLLPTYRARLRMPHDASADAGGVAAALTYSDTVTTAWLGQNQANALPLNGVLRRVRCYGAAAP